MEKLKEALYEAVILPIQNPLLFQRMSLGSPLIAVPKGILLYGPPGTGEFADALA